MADETTRPAQLPASYQDAAVRGIDHAIKHLADVGGRGICAFSERRL